MGTNTENDVLGSIADTLIGTMPEVSEHAIEEHNAQERKNDANSEPTTAPAGLATTADGRTYDPSTHQLSPQTGKIIKKRRGGGAKSVIGTTAKKAQEVVSNDQAAAVAQARASGQCAAGITVAVCVGIGGDEFNPVRDKEKDEFATLEQAYSNYFIATGRTDLPPVMGLVVAIGMYVLPRFTMPKTQTRLGALRDWAASKYLSWRGRKTMKAAAKQAAE